MSWSTNYMQSCPTCGRKLQVPVAYLGKPVACQHCHARFLAQDPAAAPDVVSLSDSELLRRADELIETVQMRLAPH